MRKHVLDITVAQLVGTNAALILENLAYWCEHNAANNANLHDGHYWTYNSTKAFAELFPYMTVNVIRHALKKLKDEGLIITGNYNKSAYDRTMWYSLTEKAETILGVTTHTDDPCQEENAAEAPAPTATEDPWADTANADPTQFQQPTAEPEPAPQPKKTRKTKSFDAIIDDYTDDPQTKDLLGAWLQNRKSKRAAMTDRAIQGCINKLDDCARQSRMNVNDYLNEIICRGWSSFFPIENYQRNGYQQQQKPRQQSQQPHWDLTEEERRKQKKADEEWMKTCVFRF